MNPHLACSTEVLCRSYTLYWQIWDTTNSTIRDACPKSRFSLKRLRTGFTVVGGRGGVCGGGGHGIVSLEMDLIEIERCGYAEGRRGVKIWRKVRYGQCGSADISAWSLGVPTSLLPGDLLIVFRWRQLQHWLQTHKSFEDGTLFCLLIVDAWCFEARNEGGRRFEDEVVFWKMWGSGFGFYLISVVMEISGDFVDFQLSTSLSLSISMFFGSACTSSRVLLKIWYLFQWTISWLKSALKGV